MPPRPGDAATAAVVTKWMEDSAAVDLLHEWMGDQPGVHREQPAVLVSLTRSRWVAAEQERDDAQITLRAVAHRLGLPHDADREAILTAIDELALPDPAPAAEPEFDPVAEGRKIGQQLVAGLATSVEKLVQNLTDGTPKSRQ